MRFEVRCQFIGTLVMNCGDCNTLNRFRMAAGRWRVRCRTCHAAYVIGAAYYRVTTQSAPLPPADLAIPRSRHDAGSPIPISPAGSDPDSAQAPSVYGGIWRSGEPITLEMPDPKRDPRRKLWLETATGRCWSAIRLNAGMRYIAEPMDGGPTERAYVGHREWRERMQPI